MKTPSRVLLAVGVALCLWVAPLASADFLLVDKNSEVSIDPTTSMGNYSWLVDGKLQLFQQWWWYRLDNGVAQSIDTLDRGPVTVTANSYSQTFTSDGNFTLTLTEILTGGNAGTGTADITEIVTISGEGAGTLHLFEYSDFDLDEDGNDDTVKLKNANTWDQSSGAGITFSETVVTPAASGYEASAFWSTLFNLENTPGYNLANTAGPLTGDVTWAWQWDIGLANNSSFLISKDKHLSVVPAPGAALLVLLGLGLVRTMKRRLS